LTSFPLRPRPSPGWRLDGATPGVPWGLIGSYFEMPTARLWPYAAHASARRAPSSRLPSLVCAPAIGDKSRCVMQADFLDSIVPHGALRRYRMHMWNVPCHPDCIPRSPFLLHNASAEIPCRIAALEEGCAAQPSLQSCCGRGAPVRLYD